MAINNEVLVAICNQNYAGHGNMLETWLTNVQRAGVKNAMVVALDAFTRDYVEAQGMVAYEMHLEVRLLVFYITIKTACSSSYDNLKNNSKRIMVS